MASLGDRLRSVRKRRGLTQRELAAESGVSLSLIRKIEQDEIPETRLETLRKLATALRVSTMTLAIRGDEERADPIDVTDLEAVRRALVGQVEQPADDPTLSGVRSALNQVTPLFKASRYSEITPVLPALIRDSEALGEQGRQLHTRILNLTGWIFTHTHQYDTAELVLDRALDQAPDRLQGSATVHLQAWLKIRQGKLDECSRIAAEWADELEPPRMSRATDTEIAVWGWMLLRIATSAIRDNRPGEAHDAMRLARGAAFIIGREVRPDPLRPFGPLLVAAKQAELAVIEGRPDHVLAVAETIPRTSVRPKSNNWNRYRLDLAQAHAKLGNIDEALNIMRAIRSQVPQWLVQQRYARDIMLIMIERRRTLTPEMRELADAVRLAY